MIRWIRRHKILSTVVLMMLFFFIICVSYIFSKLGKLSYDDGTVAEIVPESLESVVRPLVPEEAASSAQSYGERSEIIQADGSGQAQGEGQVGGSGQEQSEGQAEDSGQAQNSGQAGGKSQTQEESDVISAEEAASLEEAEMILSDAELASHEDVFNLLLLGTDERADEFSTNARADSIMLLSLNKQDKTMKLVSLQRGMGFPVLEGQYKGQYDWLTHLFRYGGADLMMKSIREVLNVDVEYYVRVNFNTFTQLIDSVGGVDVELTAIEAAGLNGEVRTNAWTRQKVCEGVNHLDGYDALQYSRLRYTDSDWKRVQRQRNVIQAVVSAAGDMNFFEVNDMLDTVLPLIQTNLTTTDILGLITYAPALLGLEFEQMTIPVKGTYGSMKGMGGRTLYAVDFQENGKILREFLYGEEEE